MGWFKKKADPISERSRALNEQIAALEAKIKKLDSQATAGSGPRLRSTALPHGATRAAQPAPAPVPAPPKPSDPIFEEVDQQRLSQSEAASTPDHYNDLGVRKYDFAALVRRIQNHFRGPSSPNTKLVNYLAAGSIQGLRPMRYEKRVARNRFLAFAIVLFLMLLGLIAALVHHNR